jgi:hypothetical protein
MVKLLSYGVFNLFFGPPLAAGGIPGIVDLPKISMEQILDASYLFGAIACAVGAWGLARASREQRGWILAFCVIGIGSYAVTAAFRAWTVSKTGSDMFFFVAQPRYHYAAQAMFAVAVCLTVAQFTPISKRAIRWSEWGFLAWVAIAVVPCAAYTRSVHRVGGAAEVEFEREIGNIRRLIESHPIGADVYIPNRRLTARHGWPTSLGLKDNRPLFPNRAGVFVVAFPENTVDGRRVHLVEENPRVATFLRAKPGTRIADLVVGPDEVP